MRVILDRSTHPIAVPASSATSEARKRGVWIIKCPWCKRYFQGNICPYCSYRKNNS